MDSGSLLAFLTADPRWVALLADLEASGAMITRVRSVEEAQASALESFDGLITSQALHQAHPELADLGLPILYGEDLDDGGEGADLIDPFAELGDRSVLRTLDRHLDRAEALIAELEAKL